MLPEQYPDHITVLSDPKDTMVTGKTNKPTQKRRYNSMLTSQSHTLTTLIGSITSSIVHAVTTSLKTKRFITRKVLSSLSYGSHCQPVTWTDLRAFSSPLSVSAPSCGPLSASPFGGPLSETGPFGPWSETGPFCVPLSETVLSDPSRETAPFCGPLNEIAPFCENGMVMGS
jgi:hypothetical protein